MVAERSPYPPAPGETFALDISMMRAIVKPSSITVRLILIVVVSIFSSLMPFFAAAATCEDLFDKAHYADTLLAVRDVKLREEFRNQKTAIDALASTLKIDLNRVTFEEVAPGTSPTFDFSDFKIRIPFESSSANAQAIGVIFAHEYSHALFESYMLRESPQWAHVRNKLKELPNEIRNLRKQVQDLEWSKLGRSDQARSDIESQQAKLKSILSAAEAQDSVMKAQNRLMLSYHEFIADLLAVSYSRDKEAMRAAAGSLGLTSNRDAELSLKWRSFAKELTADEMQEWENQVRRIYGIVQFYNPYDLLAPLRRWAGSNLLSADASLAVSPISLLNAIKQDFEVRSNTLDATSTSLDPTQMNRELANQLQLLKVN